MPGALASLILLMHEIHGAGGCPAPAAVERRLHAIHYPVPAPAAAPPAPSRPLADHTLPGPRPPPGSQTPSAAKQPSVIDRTDYRGLGRRADREKISGLADIAPFVDPYGTVTTIRQLARRAARVTAPQPAALGSGCGRSVS